MGMGGDCLNCDLCDYGITLIVPVGCIDGRLERCLEAW